MDLGNIIYIVAVLAYFIYQATRGKKQNQAPADKSEPYNEPTHQPTSFEDVLREIRNSQKPKQETVEKPKQVTVERPRTAPSVDERPEWRPDPVIRKRFPAKPIVESDEEISYYEGAFENVKSALSRTSKGVPEIPSLKETADISTRRKHRYEAMLKNPESIRDAVVLKEILDKKFF